MKNKITVEAGPSYVHISKREIPHKLSELTKHLVVQRTNEKTKKKQHARLPAQVPASSVSRSPGGNNRQERERRSARPRRRETSSRLPRRRHRKREWMPKYKHRAHVAQRRTSSRADELYQNSIEGPHRRVLSGHMVTPEAVAWAGGTQSDAAVAENTGRPFLCQKDIPKREMSSATT